MDVTEAVLGLVDDFIPSNYLPTHALFVKRRIWLRRFLIGLSTQEQKGTGMPEKETLERARKDKKEGKAASTQAGEFVREEIEHVREGKHGARSTKQAIAMDSRKRDVPA